MFEVFPEIMFKTV